MKQFAVSPVHYYGGIVRKLFLAAAAVMLLSLPISIDRLPLPLLPSIVIIVILGLFAGLTNPINSWPVIIDTLISLVGLAGFEFYAVSAFETAGADFFFLLNQALAIIFLFALYYSTKTFRAMMLESR